jgi:hypothetical protein
LSLPSTHTLYRKRRPIFSTSTCLAKDIEAEVVVEEVETAGAVASEEVGIVEDEVADSAEAVAAAVVVVVAELGVRNLGSSSKNSSRLYGHFI